MKTLIYFISITVIVISFNACAPAYVKEQPTYVVVDRPPSPGNTHVWVDGNWVWNKRTHSYVWRNGYWATPHRGRAYRPGHWQSNHHGHYWVQGSWH